MLVGLKNEIYNGHHGKITYATNKKGRYGITLHESGRLLSLKPENLKHVNNLFMPTLDFEDKIQGVFLLFSDFLT